MTSIKNQPGRPLKPDILRVYGIINMKAMSIKLIATNRKAYHDFHIGDGIEAGIALTGTEIKSIRAGQVNLRDSYVRPENGELWLLNTNIARYDAGGAWGHDPDRPRRLLLHKDQINNLASKVREKGFTIIATRLYLKDSLAKVEIALARGKKLYDKRETIARRETAREIGRALKKAKV
jgi:SsrA-binding protein